MNILTLVGVRPSSYYGCIGCEYCRAQSTEDRVGINVILSTGPLSFYTLCIDCVCAHLTQDCDYVNVTEERVIYMADYHEAVLELIQETSKTYTTLRDAQIDNAAEQVSKYFNEHVRVRNLQRIDPELTCLYYPKTGSARLCSSGESIPFISWREISYVYALSTLCRLHGIKHRSLL